MELNESHIVLCRQYNYPWQFETGYYKPYARLNENRGIRKVVDKIKKRLNICIWLEMFEMTKTSQTWK